MRTSPAKNENVACGIGDKKEPIKRHSALKQFSREHHFGLLLIWKIRQGLEAGIAPARISRYLLFFYQQNLKAHFYEEEKMLFSKLPENDVMCILAIDEHKRIDLLVTLITADVHNRDMLVKFANILEKHIRFEERSLFNYLQNTLSESELEILLLIHSEEKVAIDKKWADHFWNRK